MSNRNEKEIKELQKHLQIIIEQQKYLHKWT